MSLRWRLIISYIIVIAIALALAFVTLLLVSRPIQNRLIGVRLASQSRTAARQINTFAQQGVSLAEIARRLSNRSAAGEAHLLLLDSTATVLADSQSDWLDQPLSLPNLEPGEITNGTFRDDSGQAYNYVAAPVGTAGDSGHIVAVAPRAGTVPPVISELGSGFVAAGVVAALFSLLASLIIARSISQPLLKIAGAASAVAAGDYAHRVPENGPPEIKRVASSFNVMAGQVEAGQQAMRDFVSNVSHELKTPLTSIKGFSQAIVEGATPDPAATQRAARIIHEEASRMGRMVEELLDLARIDSGQVVMQKTTLELDQILSGAVDRLRPQAAEKEVQLVKAWDHLPQIVGDGDRLAQVFTNLLDNAIRHTPAGGRVTIGGKVSQALLRPRDGRLGLAQPDVTTALSERGDFAEVSISDTGPGIPAEDLARIFERFYQVDKSRKRGRGTGLGLAIIKEIVEAHSGYVRAESIEGVGTKFTVLLPTKEAYARTVVSSRR